MAIIEWKIFEMENLVADDITEMHSKIPTPAEESALSEGTN